MKDKKEFKKIEKKVYGMLDEVFEIGVDFSDNNSFEQIVNEVSHAAMSSDK